MDQDRQTEAVFTSVRSEVDPISGNEVPLGSTPENVRDDVPAMLSEGEYVVPADVVKFFGVKHFEDLRTEAKMGFSQMGANGRIGGEPMPPSQMEDALPFDVSELQMLDDEQPMMNRGGLIQGYADGGEVGTNPVVEGIPNPVTGLSEGSVTYVNYVNDEGQLLQIPFFNGVPMAVIPEGFFAQGSQPTAETPEDRPSRRSRGNQYASRPSRAVDYTSLSTDELIKMAEDQKGMSRDLIASGLGLLSPIVGLVARFAFNDMANKTEEEIARRAESEDYADERQVYTSLLAEVSQEKPGILARIWSSITGEGKEEEESSSEPADQDAVNRAVREALRPTSTTMSEQAVLDRTIPEPETAVAGEVYTPSVTTNGILGMSEDRTIPEAPTAVAGEVYTPEVTTTNLRDVPLIESAERAIKRSEGATPDSYEAQTNRGSNKSEMNRRKYESRSSGTAFITDSDGSKREVDTYKKEDILNSGIRSPGGR
ncbi:hypothetical protein OAD41_00115 [bacterium]|nr:hypothetical protein [bacterium]